MRIFDFFKKLRKGARQKPKHPIKLTQIRVRRAGEKYARS